MTSQFCTVYYFAKISGINMYTYYAQQNEKMNNKDLTLQAHIIVLKREIEANTYNCALRSEGCYNKSYKMQEMNFNG